MNYHSDPKMDSRLIERARSGDQAAQQTLWRQHRRWVAAIVLAHRPHSIDVDDLMQDVALKMVAKLHTLRDPEAFRPWLRRIIINICRGAARRLKPTLHLSASERNDDENTDHTTISHPVSHEVDAARSIQTQDAARKLMDQALSLPHDYREPLLLRCVRGMTYQQISLLMELPVTTIETRLARARKMLRDEIGDQVFYDDKTGDEKGK